MTKHTQVIDYSALHEPVTDVDIRAYKQFVKLGNVSRGAVNLYSKSWVLIALAVGVVMIVVSSFASNGVSLPAVFGIGVTAAVIVSVVYIGIRNAVREKTKLYKFAQRNSISFFETRPDPAYSGMIFDEGRARQIDVAYVFPGNVEMGNYQYTTGSGKSSTVHRWAYTRIILPRKLPHMVLDAKKNNTFGFSNLSDAFNKQQTLSLEGDFNKHFTLYAPKEYERDALYIFTPDVMAKLIDSGSAYDMEVVGNELYIYKSGELALDSETELQQQLAIVASIGAELRDASDYYADERVGSRAQDSIAVEGVRLKRGIRWSTVLVIVLVVTYFVVEWIITLSSLAG